jgi:hypothetical protein
MEALINVTVTSKGPVTLAIYNYKDDHILHPNEKFGRIYHLCGDSETIDNGFCSQNDTGKFIVKQEQPQFPMVNIVVAPNGPSVQYPVASTGYYCVLLASSARPAQPFTAISFTQAPYGLLPGDEYPKLPVCLFEGNLPLVLCHLVHRLLRYWVNMATQDIFVLERYFAHSSKKLKIG